MQSDKGRDELSSSDSDGDRPSDDGSSEIRVTGGTAFKDRKDVVDYYEGYLQKQSDESKEGKTYSIK
jgi:hypothetical protein